MTGVDYNSDSTSASALSRDIREANNIIATQSDFVEIHTPRLKRKKETKEANKQLKINAEKRKAEEQKLKVNEAAEADQKEDKKLQKKLQEAAIKKEMKAARKAQKEAQKAAEKAAKKAADGNASS